MAHFALATALTGNNQENLALEEYRKACVLNPDECVVVRPPGGIAGTERGFGGGDCELAQGPGARSFDYAGAETDLGMALFETGNTQEGYEHLTKAVETVSRIREWA